jgi:hypothetical protein
VPAHFGQYQNTFGLFRTLLTAKFTFGTAESVLESSKELRKAQNTPGTVPPLFAPFKIILKSRNPANTGLSHFSMTRDRC